MPVLLQTCNSCCGCDIDVAHNDGTGGDTTLDVSDQFYEAHDVAINVTGGTCNRSAGCGGGGFQPEYWRSRIYANGSLIYDSGCITGNVSTTVNVSAGTTSLRFLTETDCNNCCESGGTAQEAYYTCPA